jgi:hypothetical protein
MLLRIRTQTVKMMEKQIVNNHHEADQIAETETDAGYVNWTLNLTEDDIEALKDGKLILFTGIEYGIVLSHWKGKKNDNRSILDTLSRPTPS